MKIYIAGSLFNEAQINQRKLEGKLLKATFPSDIICNPIDFQLNKDKSGLVNPSLIYQTDEKELTSCDVLIADVSNEDPVVMLALGLAIHSSPKLIIAVNSDSRLAASNKYEIPSYSMNHFVLGAILENGYLVHSFEEAIEKIKEYIKKS